MQVLGASVPDKIPADAPAKAAQGGPSAKFPVSSVRHTDGTQDYGLRFAQPSHQE